MIWLIQGDCLETMPTLPENSLDSIVCDPPYGLKFMGKEWDHGVPGKEFWVEALRVAKPGAHLLAFGGTRMHHRLMVAIEDAGWELRDTVMWVYGSGFPKSLDVSKALDKAAGAERTQGAREWSGGQRVGGISHGGSQAGTHARIIYDSPATEAAQHWQGWGTALKPAWEPVILARKPLEGTVAQNVLKWGVGGLNIDGCRVEHLSEADRASATLQGRCTSRSGNLAGRSQGSGKDAEHARPDTSKGRWPANLLHDGSEEVVSLFPQSDTTRVEKPSDCSTEGSTSFQSMRGNRPARGYNEQGSAARFFYCAKASSKERHEGCDDPGEQFVHGDTLRKVENKVTGKGNNHPTIKPLALMRYLCKLVTPPNGVVLDPFMGSGSTGVAARLEGFGFVGIEIDPGYFSIAEKRIGPE